MEDQTRSLSEVAGLMGVSERTVRRWIKSGRLKAYKPGRDYRIPETSLRQFVEESEISPKAPAPLSLEPTFNDVLDEDRRFSVLDALQTYITTRAHIHEADLKDLESPRFRDVNSATLWVADIRQEASNWTNWLLDHASTLMPQSHELYDPQSWRNTLKVMGPILTLQEIALRAEKRIATIPGRPDDLTQKRAARARREQESSQQRYTEFKKAVSA